jgi:hypothetical protein
MLNTTVVNIVIDPVTTTNVYASTDGTASSDTTARDLDGINNGFTGGAPAAQVYGSPSIPRRARRSTLARRAGLQDD